MAGVAVILMGQSGRVLHVGDHAKRLLGNTLNVVSEHLVADTAEANSALEHLIAGAVSAQGELPSVVIERGRRRLCLRAVPMADAADDPAQLLKALVIITEA